MGKKYLSILIIVFFVFAGRYCHAVTLVSEDFNDTDYSAPLSYYTGTGYDDDGIVYVTEDVNGAGHSLRLRHISGVSGIGVLNGMQNHLGDGIYFRYWMKYPASYLFPGERGEFENLKMLKISGAAGDIEFIYKDSDNGGPKALQLFWFGIDGATTGNGTGTGATTLGQTLSKDVWHKIEIYIRISSQSAVHVQVDDIDVFQDANANILLPATVYTSAQQFISVCATTQPTDGHNEFYNDNITIVAGEGDLCANEPTEPGVPLPATPAAPAAPANLRVVE